MFSLSGSMELAQQRGISHSPVPLLQAAPSFLLLLSETWKEKQSALCWVEGNVLFNQKGRFFFFFLLLFLFHWKNLEQCNFNFAKTHFGREWGSGRLVWNAAFLPSLLLCAPLPGAVAHLCLVWCTGCQPCAVSPLPTQPFPASLLCGGRSLGLWAEVFAPVSTT